MSPDGLVTTMSRPSSWLATIGVGLAGALLGYLIFTVLLGFGDTDIFDWGGFLSALIGAFVVVPLAGLMMKRANAERHPRDRP
ncbi:MAG TPA: hypothetical protein VFR88_12630 [Microlunatus sp.]|nr:hypothetical protein [Microlunatus sp.]